MHTGLEGFVGRAIGEEQGKVGMGELVDAPEQAADENATVLFRR